MEELHGKMVKATKWSMVTEISAKLISPLSTMVLARLLTPADFGIMVTALMVISFAEIFTDAGFQKYIIQHDFSSREDLYKSTNVAFWSNLIMSIAIWVIIIIFCQPIAHLVGSPGRGDVIAVSCFCIPLAAFSSIQMALYKRDLEFKTLFIARVAGILTPILITLPIAWITRSYWALIVGMVVTQLSNAVILTWKSKWKPKFNYDIKLFKEMFSFTGWSMLEALAIWLTSYVDLFIVGTVLSQYYLGLYRTSMNTVGQIMGLVTASITSIVFSSLSKLQNDDERLREMFLRLQKIISILVLPMGVGIFVFRDFITDIYLGDQWKETAWFTGLWALTGSLTIIMSHFNSELLRAKGKPSLSTIAQILHISILVPVVLWAVHQDYSILCDCRAMVRLTMIIILCSITYHIVKISIWDMLKNISFYIFATVIMGCTGAILIWLNNNLWLQILYIVICVIIYFGILACSTKERHNLLSLKKHILKK